MLSKIIIYIFLISISIHAFVCAQQDCQTVLTQCQKYNTIALDAYKKCHGKFDKLNEKFDKVKVNLNHSKIEVHHCKESSSRCTILVVVPWVLLGNFFIRIKFWTKKKLGIYASKIRQIQPKIISKHGKIRIFLWSRMLFPYIFTLCCSSSKIKFLAKLNDACVKNKCKSGNLHFEQYIIDTKIFSWKTNALILENSIF